MKVKRNCFDRVIDIICLLVLVGITIYLIVRWNAIPDRIPAHYNGKGEIDRMGGKAELLITPVSNWILYLFMKGIEHAPQLWNTGITVTEENKERVYRITANLLRSIKLLTVLCFGYLALCSINCTSLSVWFLPVSMIGTFGTVIYYGIRIVINR